MSCHAYTPSESADDVTQRVARQDSRADRIECEEGAVARKFDSILQHHAPLSRPRPESAPHVDVS
eukprot:1621767-Rhodomonas_salina.3